jgi:hypothetical protein
MSAEGSLAGGSAAASEDPLAGAEGPSPGAGDADFEPSSSEERRGGSASVSEAEWSSELSDDSRGRRARRAKKRRATPEGARRSGRGRAGGDERGGGGSDESSDDGGSSGGSPAAPGAPLVLARPPAELADVGASVAALRGMWEMAAVLDFLRLFRPQLAPQFGALAVEPTELERVLVTSPGADGLLAEVHLALMRGISPKGEASGAPWPAHLANKLRFHWRPLSDGGACPFRPEKHGEAAAYAALPAPARARALHFLCCLRADREDVGARLAEAERAKTKAEVAAAEAEGAERAARAARGTRSRAAADDDADPPTRLEGLDDFRREPTGVDASGASYYFFETDLSGGASGAFRLYKETPAAAARGASTAASASELAAAARAEEAAVEVALAAQAAAAAEAARKRGRKRSARAEAARPPAAARPAGRAPLRHPPQAGRWELVAAAPEELRAVGERLARSLRPADKALGRLLVGELLPAVEARLEEGERRRRAAERVQSRLGIAALEEAAGGGRGRRVRGKVDYTGAAYDEELRRAIRHSSRGGADEEPRRSVRGRGSTPPADDPFAAAQAGMRRGRSLVGAADSDGGAPELDERALRRAAQRARGAAGAAAGSADGGDGGEDNGGDGAPRPAGQYGSEEPIEEAAAAEAKAAPAALPPAGAPAAAEAAPRAGPSAASEQLMAAARARLTAQLNAHAHTQQAQQYAAQVHAQHAQQAAYAASVAAHQQEEAQRQHQAAMLAQLTSNPAALQALAALQQAAAAQHAAWGAPPQ